MGKYRSSDAILLRGVSYGEGHRLFTCFGREEGKYTAVARGVLKPKSKLKGHLQLGNRCDLQLAEGRGMATIASALAKETFPANREKTERYFHMSYFLELLNDFLPDGMADPALFDVTNDVLKALGDTDPPLLARFFELKLLAAAGFAPDLETCSRCGAELNGGAFNGVYHGMLCPRCGDGIAIPPKAHFALKFLASAEVPQVRRLKLDAASLTCLAAVTKTMIEGSLEKKVRSLEILKQIPGST